MSWTKLGLKESNVKLIALYSYDAQDAGYLSFKMGDEMLLIKKSDANRWYVTLLRTNEKGYVPRNHVCEQKPLQSEAWYAGRITRERAERLVLQDGQPQGTFLIRERIQKHATDADNHYFALTVRESLRQAHHYKILQLKDSAEFYIAKLRTFDSLQDLVRFYCARSDGLCCRLTAPAPREIAQDLEARSPVEKSDLTLSPPTTSIPPHNTTDTKSLPPISPHAFPNAPPPPMRRSNTIEKPLTPDSDVAPLFRVPPRPPKPSSRPTSITESVNMKTEMQPVPQVEEQMGKAVSAVQLPRFEPGEYECQGRLGSGGFGVVFKCFDEKQKRLFAAKEIESRDDEVLKSGKEEAEKLQLLRHPRIIEYYGYKMESNKIIIFMEYMSEGSLLQVIKDRGVVEERVAKIYISQVLDGLSFIHDKGIVHGDLKCDNLLMDCQGRLKLGDFGIAIQKCLNSANYSITAQITKGCGSLYWMAHELVQDGGGTRSRRNDIWSLGCTIVEMLTGKPPHSKLSGLKFLGAVDNKSLTYDPNELVSKASSQMKQFLSTLLQINPTQRPHTATDASRIFERMFAEIKELIQDESKVTTRF